MIFLLSAGLLLSGLAPVWAQQITKSAAFPYQADLQENHYTPRVKQKTLVLDETSFIVLNKKAAQDYRITYYLSDLQKEWETTLTLADKETLEAFSHNDLFALILTRRSAAAGSGPSIYGMLIDLRNGKKGPSKKLLEAPAGNRRIGTVLSDDGTKLLAYYQVHQQSQLESMVTVLFDGKLNKLKSYTHSFRDLDNMQLAGVHMTNTGTQYISLMARQPGTLAMRRYSPKEGQHQTLKIQIGGMSGEHQVYVRDAFFAVQPDNQAYAAVLCADDKTGAYHSLKVLRFDFNGKEIKSSPGFMFSPQYLSQGNKAPAEPLEDIYLTDLIVSAPKDLLVITEKKYQQRPGKPFVAKEMRFFAYDSFLNPTWNTVIDKHQTAAADAGFSSISYKGQLWGSELNLLTLEQIKGRTELFRRKINLKTGVIAPPNPLGLLVNEAAGLTYLKDFTIWFNKNNILTVLKPRGSSTAQVVKMHLP